MDWDLEIQIEAPYQDQVQPDWLKQAATATFICGGLNEPAEISLLITDDMTMRELNRTYRGVDKTTDVLAFAFQDEAGDSPFPSSPDGICYLGEVIISFPQAARQAQEHQQSIRGEMELLVVHGMLHLLGYDHEDTDGEMAMQAKEKEILSSLNSDEITNDRKSG